MSQFSDIHLDLRGDEFFKYPEFVETTSNILKPDIHYSVNLNEEPRMQVSDYLVAFSSETQSYCVGVVDMVNSTKIAAILGGSRIAKYYQVFLNSMSKILSNFGGSVIKNVGDCLLYYFPDSNKTRYDFQDSLECSLAMIDSHDIICEKLKNENLFEVDYRISMDYGTIVKMSVNGSYRMDMIGPTINMCSKINHYAHKNGIVLGGDMYEIVKKLKEYDMKQIGDYSVGFRNSYPMYSLSRS